MYQGVMDLIGFGVADVSVTATISVAGSATSTAATITAPASVNAGDLMVLLDSAFTAAFVPTSVVPSGFTSISDITTAKTRQIVSYRICDGSEDSATITGMDGADTDSKALYLFRRSPAASAVNVSAPNSEATGGNPTSQTVSASGGAAPLVVIGCYGAQTSAVDPRTFSPDKDGEINPSTYAYLAYKIYNSAPADVSVDMDDEGTASLLQSFYVELT